jgi:hypothetical protein
MELKAIPRYLRLCAVACLAVFSLTASEQHGTVKFGAVAVPGATVTATRDNKKVVAITDENGAYSFPDLEDGVWKIQVEMLCFTTVSKEIGVAPGSPGAEWELKLQSMDEIKPAAQAPPPPGTAATGTAPAAAAGTTPATAATPQPAATQTAAATGKAAKGKKGAAAPAAPQAGFQRTDVNASGDAPPPSGAASATPSIAEAQSSSDAFVVNGSTSNGIERRAIGNGRKGPGSLFNGGIDFRGFENDLLDARSYSITGQDTPRSPYTQYTIGASLQGPLWVPHVFHWTGNFYLQLQTTRNRNASNQPYTMPTALEREGNFTGVTTGNGSPLVLLDPNNNNAPLPTPIIPQSEISPQAQKLLGFYPLPQFTAPGVSYNYEVPIVTRSVQDQFVTRLNKPINNKSRLSGIFVFQDNSNQNNNVFNFVDHIKTQNYRANTSYNRNFTRTFYGNFTVDYTRSSVKTLPFFANNTTYGNVSGDAGITGNLQDPANWGPPSLSFGGSGIAGMSDTNSKFVRNQTTAFNGTITYIRRPHQFQLGGDFKVQDFSTVGQSNPRGSFGFNGAATGFDFADFLFGTPDTTGINYSNADKYLRSNLYDVFVNDNWNVNSSLTLQWGVRWDYASPITEEYGRLANLDIAPGFTSAMPVTAGDPVGPLSGLHYPSSLIKPDKHQISPRVSFAWRPIFGSSMVVRGGYGIYYLTSIYTPLAAQMDQEWPAPGAKILAGTSAQYRLTLANGFPNPITQVSDLTTATFGVDPNFRVGFTHQYYVSVQQNITASLLLTAQYNGVKGTRAVQEFEPNTTPYGVPLPNCISCLGYVYLTSNGNSTRNAGQLSLRRRFHSGISTNFSYVYSKSIDDAATLGSSSGGSIAQNWLNLAGERGLSSFDQRNVFTAQLQYSTGVGVHGGALLSGWRGLILKGWTFTSNINAGSGLPFSPLYSLPLQGTSAAVLRPEYLGGDVYSSPNATGRYLNAAAYAAPPTGEFGDAGRDTLTGPRQFSMNGSMARSFADKYTVTFNASNLLNHPIFAGWSNSFNPLLLNGGAFGQLLPPAQGSMRSISATIRWTF